ncbi:RDD family protein [Pseudoalteromonas sp. JBTF-M23]|uniref:RDD family protein n=1 Tax=Pseudoalteromonas caenipelagi TaxID=2726988 RepID=A0A849VD11_9GAMM|nr:RDD family protein [Pseudoalteromonas caenipelagi]NOU51569.1 RDD family protein [Pseudoalteromonas caenipelagi]
MSQFPSAGFFRRFASLIYDGLVVIAFAMLTTVIYLLIIQGFISAGILTIGAHPDVSAYIQASPTLYTIRAVLLVLVAILFYAYFWTKSGQTIGMRAWRLKVQTHSGELLPWSTALSRSICALCGLGNLFVLVDFKKKRALQDLLCKTEVIVLTKEENKKVYNSLD